MKTNIGKKAAAVFGTAVLLSVYAFNAAGTPLTEGSGADALDEIQESYAETVDPFIGTGGAGLAAGFVYPGATRPFGMVQLTSQVFPFLKEIFFKSFLYKRKDFLFLS